MTRPPNRSEAWAGSTPARAAHWTGPAPRPSPPPGVPPRATSRTGLCTAPKTLRARSASRAASGPARSRSSAVARSRFCGTASRCREVRPLGPLGPLGPLSVRLNHYHHTTCRPLLLLTDLPLCVRTPVGLGTCGLADGAVKATVANALAMGYRLVDSSGSLTDNHLHLIGEAVPLSERGRVWLTTRIWPSQNGFDGTYQVSGSTVRHLGHRQFQAPHPHPPSPSPSTLTTACTATALIVRHHCLHHHLHRHHRRRHRPTCPARPAKLAPP